MKLCLSVLTTDTRGRSLAECLEAINALRRDELARLHVLVVQNGASVPSERILNAASIMNFPTTVVAEPRRGIPIARNRAIDFALENGLDHLAFIDDDAVPDRNWLSVLVRGYRATQADAVTGPQVPVFSSDAPPRLRHAAIYRERRIDCNSACRWAASHNVLFSVRFVERHGLRFNEAFRTGGSDKEFFMRFSAAGGIIRWIPEAVVREAVPPERLSLNWAVLRAWRLGTTGFNIERSVRSDLKAGLVACGKGMAYIGLGLVTLPTAVVPRSPGLVNGLCHIAHGTGFLAGLSPRLRIRKYV